MTAKVPTDLGLPLAGLVLVLSSLLVSCSGGDDTDTPTGSTQVTETAPPAVGGVGVEAYPTPVVRAEGGYYPPAYDPTRADENRAADETIRQLPLFSGEINGFRLFTPGEYERKWPCDDAEASAEAAEPEELPFQVTYFPPGTTEEMKPFIRRCPDGSIYYTGRLFRVTPAAFSVTFTGGELTMYNDDFRVGHVKAAEFHGHKGVLVEPYTEAGSGGSMALWPSGDGYIRVSADGLPVDELLKIVEGVTCADCTVRD